MAREMLALFLYVGLTAFFAVVAVALLQGVAALAAVTRGVVALALFAALGVVASLAARPAPQPDDQMEARGGPSDERNAAT